ncbi:MAG: mechanosensitive ion channel family protein [Flavipsychrobacter sp.]|nr:mechanosensitive ion channel family protein [Flavipsychrobacter sp.]
MLLTIDITIFDQTYMGERVVNYIWFVGIVIATLLLRKPLANLLMRISSRLAERYSYIKHKARIHDLLFRPLERLLLIIFFFVATEQIAGMLDHIAFHRKLSKRQLDINLGDITDHIFLFLFIIFFTRVITRFIDFIYYVRIGKANEDKNRSQQQLLPLIKEMSKLITWTFSIFWILGAVFHVNIPALITGLGIGGVAIALAGKETVENFFAAFTILSDKPFATGETIKLGEIEGVVERIGFRSTRLRNADGSAHIIPNQNLVSQNLINLSTRDNRGMKVAVNIRYGISHNDLEQLITDIKEALPHIPPVKAPIEAHIETFDKETFQLVVSYHLPHPLPNDETLNALRRKVNMKVYELVSSAGTLGTPTVTS